MIKKKIVLIAILLLCIFIPYGCKKDGEEIITVTSTQDVLVLKDSEVATYDFKSLFIIEKDGQSIDVTDEYINKSNVTSTAGTYVVTCTYQGVKKDINVVVNKTIYIVSLTQDEITIDDTLAENYDYLSMFTVSIDGEEVEITSDMIESHVINEPGTYDFKVTIGNSSKTLKVIVIKKVRVYNLELSQDEITINETLTETYDYLSLFAAYADGEKISITSDMIESNVSKEPGTYSYKVTLGDVVKTLTVNVTSDHDIMINVSYNEVNIVIDEVSSFDYTTLFDLYVDGKVVKVTKEMIDLSTLESAELNKSYEISMSYTQDKTTCSKTAKINIVADSELTVNTKNIVAYPNSEYIDVLSLFEIRKGDEVIKVTSDMVEGAIDYSQVGINTITLTYKDVEYVSTVEISRGVIINYAKSDIITIAKGTSLNSYAFANDFIVYVNGLKMSDVLESYINIENVDFNTVGEYDVTITIPYNYDTIPARGDVKFVYYDKTIKYKVIDNNYQITVKNDFVTLPKGTTTYNVFSNLSVSINNRDQTLTTIKEYVDVITCYAECNTVIDFASIGEQEVTVLIYVNGVDNDPIEVIYKVIMESDIEVIANDALIFTSDTLYTTELFKIKNGEENIDVTYDMITGKVDTFTPGVYYITINYQDIIKEAKVIVYDRSILGTYHTFLTTIGSDSSTSSDEEGYEEEVAKVTKLKDLIFNSFEDFVVNENKCSVISGIDENTLIVKIGSNEFTLYYDNGIIILDPDNSIRLGFNSIKRPYLYFNEEVWKIAENVTINYSSSHVLQLSTITYSIDTVNIKSLVDESEMWYGLKISLVEKSSSDTIYTVTWGEVKYADDFNQTVDASSTLEFENETYTFTMTSNNVGKVSKIDSEKRYANMSFTGTIDGQSARLICNANEGFDLSINGNVVASITSPSYLNMCNIEVNYSDASVLISGWNEEVFAYKFIVDTTTLTFTYVEKDRFYGKYTTPSMYIYIDGYGNGCVNFNTQSYYTTKFTYDVSDNRIDLLYNNTKVTFEYGKTMSMYIDDFNNTLTIIEDDSGKLVGTKLENSHIVDGAIVHINSYKVGAQSATLARPVLYSNIEIITKDGVLSNEEKASLIDTTKIRFSTKGFYQMIINIPVNGVVVSQYYAIQILEKVYENNPVATSFGNGVIFNNNSIAMDIYGQAFVTCQGVNYSGSCVINDDNSFIIKAKNETGSILISGVQVADGIVMARCSGAVSFTDYFTTGTCRSSGNKTCVLREFNVKGVVTYILCSSASTTGVVVTVEKQSETILKVTNNGVTSFMKIINWNNTNSGLQLADNYIGTYSSQEVTIILDGFGNATVNGSIGTYILNNNVAIITTQATTKVYELDNQLFTFEEVAITLDNSLLVGKTYSSSYVFACSGYYYNAETSFQFKENGVVVIKSTSESHDSSEESCAEDSYSPDFASKTGVNGKYSVNGNILTITVNNIQFTFVIDNVLKLDTITCSSTTLTNNDHGMFGVNTVFSK